MTVPLHQSIAKVNFSLLPHPTSVKTISTLGEGRAARAILCDATLDCGKKIRCVEKRFSPGWLTRIIYRICFQAPFAYQSNRDAILACYHRRIVVGQILRGLNSPVHVAKPLYVRFDRVSNCWVLAAEWIQGRGIRPMDTDATRPRRVIRRFLGLEKKKSSQGRSEMSELLETMRVLEVQLRQSGLIGTGWQVSPAAMVSTANLLRVENQYTVIDLESGIPAILVAKYLIDGIKNAHFPPFDELDHRKLKTWVRDHRSVLSTNLGVEGLAELEESVDQLIWHHLAWKNSEVAIFRKPWKFFNRKFYGNCAVERLRRWQQERTLDQATLASRHRLLISLIWLCNLFPGKLFRFAARYLGDQNHRRRTHNFLLQPKIRKRVLRFSLHRHWASLIRTERVPNGASPSWKRCTLHRMLRRVTPTSLHRFLSDSHRRKQLTRRVWRLTQNRAFQNRYGKHLIRRRVDRWTLAGRMDGVEADRLRHTLSNPQIRDCLRGFGFHVGLKFLSPVFTPLKIIGLVGFYETKNVLLLIPFLVAPILRLSLTLVNQRISHQPLKNHRVALLLSWLPVLGTLAYPAQLYSSNLRLSRFLIRDFASNLGRKFPIYGGENTRLEIGLIEFTDWFFSVMTFIAPDTHDHSKPIALSFLSENMETTLNIQNCMDQSPGQSDVERNGQKEDFSAISDDPKRVA